MTSRRMLLLLAPLLAGCVEAQERQMAQCRLEATKELTREQITAGQHTAPIRACMLAGGYEFNDTLADCRAATEGFISEQAACYEPMDFVGRLTHRLEVFVRRRLPY